MMSFQDAVRTCLTEKYITFSGRAQRSEYWWFVLFSMIVMMVVMGIAAALGGIRAIDTGQFTAINYVMMLVMAVVVIGLYIPMICANVRRFHDRDLSGWWVLAAIVLGNVPFVGFLASIAAFVITVLKGTNGPNRFGDDPLNPSSGADVFA